MCCRYVVSQGSRDPQVLIELLNRASLKSSGPIKRGEVLPSDLAPVLTLDRVGHTGAFGLRFGFVVPRPVEPPRHEQLSFLTDVPDVPDVPKRPPARLVINARSETARQKPLFAGTHRCLIPALSFDEWSTLTGEKVRYGFTSRDEEWFCMAALCRRRPGERDAEFVILTQAASDDIAPYHDRMPVVTTLSGGEAWLREASLLPGQLLTGFSAMKREGA